MIKLLKILEIKNIGGKNLQELMSYIKKYNDIISKLKDIKDTYKNHGQGYAPRFNIVGDSSSSPSRINQFQVPKKINIENITFAYKYAGFEPFTKWASNSSIVQNLTGDTKQDIEDLKNRIKTFIKDYYLDKKRGYEKQVDRSILDLKKLYQDDLDGEEILGEYDVQGGLSSNVDDDESWMYDDLGGPFNEIYTDDSGGEEIYGS